MENKIKQEGKREGYVLLEKTRALYSLLQPFGNGFWRLKDEK